MVKKKAKAIFSAADGTGGMTDVKDRRFESGDWPIHFDVPNDEADTWLRYFAAECTRRGWTCPSIAQQDVKENSGSITVNTGPGQPQLAVIWERKRGGPIKVKARSAGTPVFSLDQANEFFERVNEISRAGIVAEFHRVGLLCYERLPWRGELWLNDNLRLGPPSQQDETCQVRPRIVIVNAQVKGIDGFHASSVFQKALRELSVFLTVVMGGHVQEAPNSRRDWTWSFDAESGVTKCELGNIGYLELPWPTEMPTRGQIPPVPLKAVERPDFSPRGIEPEETEQGLPEDIVDLWQAFEALPPELRNQFLQVGSMWQLGLSLGHKYETARFAYMVAACEALKPQDPKFRDHNIYPVVDALLGKPTADSLRQKFQPHDVRSAHFHSGAFRGSEFAEHATLSTFWDPTFHDASSELYKICASSDHRMAPEGRHRHNAAAQKTAE